jgi:hypothetical protein
MRDLKSRQERINTVESSPLAKGKNEYLRYLNGKNITKSEAILGNCYLCIGYASDGKCDCKMPLCPLHPWMPYREEGVRKSRLLSEEQRIAAGDRLKKARLCRSDSNITVNNERSATGQG